MAAAKPRRRELSPAASSTRARFCRALWPAGTYEAALSDPQMNPKLPTKSNAAAALEGSRSALRRLFGCAGGGAPDAPARCAAPSAGGGGAGADVSARGCGRSMDAGAPSAVLSATGLLSAFGSGGFAGGFAFARPPMPAVTMVFAKVGRVRGGRGAGAGAGQAAGCAGRPSGRGPAQMGRSRQGASCVPMHLFVERRSYLCWRARCRSHILFEMYIPPRPHQADVKQLGRSDLGRCHKLLQACIQVGAPALLPQPRPPPPPLPPLPLTAAAAPRAAQLSRSLSSPAPALAPRPFGRRRCSRVASPLSTVPPPLLRPPLPPPPLSAPRRAAPSPSPSPTPSPPSPAGPITRRCCSPAPPPSSAPPRPLPPSIIHIYVYPSPPPPAPITQEVLQPCASALKRAAPSPSPPSLLTYLYMSIRLPHCRPRYSGGAAARARRLPRAGAGGRPEIHGGEHAA